MDNKEFTKLAVRLRPLMRLQARRCLASAPRGCDTAEDVVQDTLLRLWTVRDRLGAYRSIEAVAMVTVRRTALDALRHAGAHPSETIDPTLETPSPDLAPDAVAELNIAEELASNLLSKIPDRQTMIVRMRHADGLEIDQIAALTGITEGNVRMLLSRGRTRLRQLYLKL